MMLGLYNGRYLAYRRNTGCSRKGEGLVKRGEAACCGNDRHRSRVRTSPMSVSRYLKYPVQDPDDTGFSPELARAEAITDAIRSVHPHSPEYVPSLCLVSIARSLEIIAMAIGNHDNAEGMAGSLSDVGNALQAMAFPA